MKIQLLSALSVLTLLLGCGSKDAAPPATPPAAPPPAAPAAAPEKKAAPAADNNSSGSPLTAPVDYLATMAKAKKSADKTIETTSLNQQVQQFYAQEGRYPKDLQELVTMNYMKYLPTPPFNMEFKYDPATGTVQVVPKPQ